jgi:hypothetical protein
MIAKTAAAIPRLEIGVGIRLRTEGFGSLCAEMRARDPERRAA